MPRSFSSFSAAAGRLLLALGMTACGGAGSSGEATTRPLTLNIVAPASADEVFDANTPITISARVSGGAGAEADGTAVTFSATTGTFSPPAVLLRSGAAASTLSSPALGRQQLTVALSLAGQTSLASQTLYLRPRPAKLELLIPAYFYPSSGSPWAVLSATAAAHPALRMTAILNPDNGVFSSADVNFSQATTQYVNAGGRLLGYVYTRYGTGSRSLASIKTNIDNYFRFYGRERISGIFLDEMAAETRRLDFYREIYRHIKSIDPTLRVVGNPGLIPAPDYATVVDAMVTFEGTGAAYQTYDPRVRNDWLYGLGNATQAMLTHNVADCAAMQVAVQAAASAHHNQGLIFVTDREFNFATGVGNPWAGLPRYWAALAETLNALNQGTALPTC